MDEVSGSSPLVGSLFLTILPLPCRGIPIACIFQSAPSTPVNKGKKESSGSTHLTYRKR